MPLLSWVWVTAYDWRACARAIARVWSASGDHVVGIDRRGFTWGGGTFSPPNETEFRSEVAAARNFSVSSARERIRFVYGDFYDIGLDTADNETCERNALTWLARPRTWICTMDSDETIVNLDEFLAWLGDKPVEPHLTWTGTSAACYKIIGDTALVAMWQETPVLLGRPGSFTGPRAPSMPVQLSPMRFVNWFLCQDDGTNRPDAEVRLKLESTSHLYSDRDAVFDRWQATTLENFREVKGIGGNYPGVYLRPISVADLRAGRWEALK
jgi:hypothetical protein